MVGQTRLHRRGDAKGLVNPTVVVVNSEKGAFRIFKDQKRAMIRGHETGTGTRRGRKGWVAEPAEQRLKNTLTTYSCTSILTYN
jgi:ribosomal protein L19E